MISAERLQAVAAWLEQPPAGADFEAALRATFPDLHFTFCSDDDVMLDQPAAACGGYRLYFVDAGSHCLSLTTDAAAASGLVVAEVEDDD